KRDNRCWKAGVSMMKVLAVMTYFQISLPTHNWDSAFFYGRTPAIDNKGARRRLVEDDRAYWSISSM
ncbi:hypothetical protein, partial [Aeromonas caviae]|uniref:hypothetical protein n=1 Tax=Aeromonas caviae TaxID=648 RepID=UPI003F7477DE